MTDEAIPLCKVCGKHYWFSPCRVITKRQKHREEVKSMIIQPEIGGKREEITDLFAPEAIDKLKVGQVLKFEQATIRITKVDRKAHRIWGQHTKLYDPLDPNFHMNVVDKQ